MKFFLFKDDFSFFISTLYLLQGKLKLAVLLATASRV